MPKTMPIEINPIRPSCVVFGLKDVLCRYDSNLICRNLAKYCSLSEKEISALIVGTGAIIVANMLGQMNSGKFYNAICQLLKTRKLDYTSFCKIWGNVFSDNPEIISVLQRLRPGITPVLVENISEIQWEWAKRTCNETIRFFQPKHCVLSYRVCSGLPNRAMLMATLMASGVAPHRILVIDSAKSNLVAFAKLGVRGITYECGKHQSSSLMAKLDEYGLIKSSPS